MRAMQVEFQDASRVVQIPNWGGRKAAWWTRAQNIEIYVSATCGARVDGYCFDYYQTWDLKCDEASRTPHTCTALYGPKGRWYLHKV